MKKYKTTVKLINNEKTIKIPRVLLTQINFTENEEINNDFLKQFDI